MIRPASLLPALWLLAALSGLAGPTPAEVAAHQPDPVRERWVEAEGVRVRALCTTGRPEVLLLHDESSSAQVWLPVLQRLEGRVGACAYDRPGHGESDPAPRRRGWFELLEQLASVHEALAGDGPVVLAGHGVGGLYARLLAVDRPGPVAGLVLLDPETEGMLEDMAAGMPTDVYRARRAARVRPNADGVRLRDLLDRASRRSLPDLPVTVVTPTRRPQGDGWTARWINEAARRHQGRLAAGLRLGRHVPARGSGPDVPAEAPELVADEIVRVVGLRSR